MYGLHCKEWSGRTKPKHRQLKLHLVFTFFFKAGLKLISAHISCCALLGSDSEKNIGIKKSSNRISLKILSFKL